jgi:hypothetical protein
MTAIALVAAITLSPRIGAAQGDAPAAAEPAPETKSRNYGEMLDDALVLLPLLRVLADPKAKRRLQRNRKGQIPLLAFVDRVLRLAQVEPDELE